MPALSKAMRKAAAIAEHHPEQLYSRNKAMANMTQEELHKIASTPEKNLPAHVSKKKSMQSTRAGNTDHQCTMPKGKVPDGY